MCCLYRYCSLLCAPKVASLFRPQEHTWNRKAYFLHLILFQHWLLRLNHALLPDLVANSKVEAEAGVIY